MIFGFDLLHALAFYNPDHHKKNDLPVGLIVISHSVLPQNLYLLKPIYECIFSAAKVRGFGSLSIVLSPDSWISLAGKYR